MSKIAQYFFCPCREIVFVFVMFLHAMWNDFSNHIFKYLVHVLILVQHHGWLHLKLAESRFEELFATMFEKCMVTSLGMLRQIVDNLTITTKNFTHFKMRRSRGKSFYLPRSSRWKRNVCLLHKKKRICK